MARYICIFWVNTDIENLRKLLERCELEVIYQEIDYLKARDFPGQISLAEFIVIDILLDITKKKQDKVPITLVMGNKEIPGSLNNRCWQKFQQILQAIQEQKQWQVCFSAYSCSSFGEVHFVSDAERDEQAQFNPQILENQDKLAVLTH